ncbi:HPr family phosphocarrier protein [Paenibacillus alkalitolerans]|uniref:HPr family phosphocarrier protein n=1 Tax=Paenibacillus alkalitolerans TaxID=2799335 RepID=UPI0018F591D2|nr:HPr family phosphocarrier protein [Paenibacillus alkalitolerans]
MITKEATIRNATGFHIRPAQLFTEKANAFKSTITIKVLATNTEVDGKSILGLMTLGLEKGSVITITANGEDEEQALDELVKLVESGFGEA